MAADYALDLPLSLPTVRKAATMPDVSAVSPTDEDLLERVGRRDRGAFEVLYKRWLESPTAPNGLNYNVPMSAALRNAFKKPSSSFDPDVYVVN